MYINDLVPFDFDNYWEKESVKQLDELLKSYAKTPNMYFSCNIDFVVADSIFTNTIKVNKTLEFANTPVEKENIRAYLLSNKLCLADETTTEQLKELARICGNYFPLNYFWIFLKKNLSRCAQIWRCQFL